jgi:prefoldin subunit 5
MAKIDISEEMLAQIGKKSAATLSIDDLAALLTEAVNASTGKLEKRVRHLENQMLLLRAQARSRAAARRTAEAHADGDD